jgi:hypothetical protein
VHGADEQMVALLPSKQALRHSGFDSRQPLNINGGVKGTGIPPILKISGRDESPNAGSKPATATLRQCKREVKSAVTRAQHVRLTSSHEDEQVL